ncbi:class I SAM-dependent methyltransferase [bacterium]|nr:class I SAM-dependent methyltransferase [bacterium]MCP5462110.1 class I SAM-dependent methyltransferase [bacterium]
MEKQLYDEMFAVEEAHWWFVGRRNIVLYLLRKFLAKSKTHKNIHIADIGCGCGANILAFQQYYTVTGFEPFDDAVSYCRKRGISVRKGALPDAIDAERLSFDAVVMLDVLEHIKEDTKSLERVHELLRDDGIILLTVPAYQWLYSPRDAEHHHVRRYAKPELDKKLRHAGFEPVLLSYYNFCLFPIVAFVRIMSKIIPSRKMKSDVWVPVWGVNKVLRFIFQIEKYVLRITGFPFGVSLIAVCRKKGENPAQYY